MDEQNVHSGIVNFKKLSAFQFVAGWWDTNTGRRAVGGVFTAHFQRDDATY
jgi:hypothetical protein